MSAKPPKNSTSRSTVEVFLLLLLAVPHGVCRAEYFSSVRSLEELVGIELRLVKVFRQYIDGQQKDLADYQNFLGHIKTQQKSIQEVAEEYFEHPINAFKSINRIVTDWDQLGRLMTENAEKYEMPFKRLKYPMPDYSDLRGSVMTLVRLQKMYNLKTRDLANGVINGIDYRAALDWQESYEIAKTLFKEKEFSFAINWFKETLKIMLQENYDPSHHKIQINSLTYMALANLKLGFPAEAKKCLKKVSKISLAEGTHSSRSSEATEYRALNMSKFSSFSNYSRLCQGILLPEKLQQQLKCKLDTQNNPIFILAPLKREEISLDPEITLYHGILNDAQISGILRSAAKMKRILSRISNDTVDGEKVSDIRVSQQTWLYDYVPIKRKLNSLLSEITGFNMINSEAMQVVSYASGGVYNPHFDYNGVEVVKAYSNMWLGNRISTNVFYLSNVEQGGYTVFPNLNVYLRPEKGSLVTWFNLHRSLDEDRRLLHAGCPVIKGSKRIANIWIHSGYQEFARPCDLINDAYKSEPYEI